MRKGKTSSGLSFCEVLLPVTPSAALSGIKNWQPLAERIEQELLLNPNEVLNWILQQDTTARPDQLTFWATVELLRDGDRVSVHHGVVLTYHQIEPENIGSYADLVAQRIKKDRDTPVLATV